MFSIVVPCGDAAKVREREAPSSADVLDGCTVLVVEDEAQIRAAMTILLEGWRCRVLSASSGTEADALLLNEDNVPDMILADYRLPAGAPWCGTAVMAFALWLFWRSHADLGQNPHGFVDDPDDQLVTQDVQAGTHPRSFVPTRARWSGMGIPMPSTLRLMRRAVPSCASSDPDASIDPNASGKG